MKTPLYDPKNLTQWMELDYFRRTRALNRVIRWMGWLAFVVAVCFVGWSCLPANRHVHQAGPLTPAHAMFQNRCDTCHTQSFPTLGRFVFGNRGIHAVNDHTCVQCHAGPPHQSAPWSQFTVNANNCASCHKEHRGKMSLTLVGDAHCTSCHSSLNRQFAKTTFANVDSLARHPEFRLWDKATDPGTIHFNHKAHMALLDLQADNAPELFKRPGFAKNLALLRQKNCNYCHQLDAAGQYVKPVQYKVHCSNCHPLQIRIVQPAGEEFHPDLREPILAFAQTPVAHPHPGQSATEVRSTVRGRYLRFAQRHAALIGKGTKKEPERGLPGARRGPTVHADIVAWAEAQLQHGERMLFDGADGCRRCHDERNADTRKNGLPDYGTPSMPKRWFPHAKFNHQSHRMLECISCHPGGRTSEHTKEVLMPRMDSCRRCHHKNGGARSDCIECHTYHHKTGDEWQGLLKIEDCTR